MIGQRASSHNLLDAEEPVIGLGFPFEALTPVAVARPVGKVSRLNSVIRRADLTAVLQRYVMHCHCVDVAVAAPADCGQLFCAALWCGVVRCAVLCCVVSRCV